MREATHGERGLHHEGSYPSLGQWRRLQLHISSVVYTRAAETWTGGFEGIELQ